MHKAPKNSSWDLFASFLDPQNLHLGIQLGAILALSLVSRRPKRPPRPSQEATWSHLGSQICLKPAQEASSTPPKGLPAPSGNHFWWVFARFSIDFDQQTTSSCYIVTLLYCYFVTLLLLLLFLLARWRGRSFAALWITIIRILPN